jgi:hypothetical protein
MNAQSYTETLGRVNVGRCGARRSVNTNLRYKGFNQAVYTAGDIDQFNSSRVRGAIVSRAQPAGLQPPGPVDPFWEKFSNIDARAVANTFSYLFNKFKKGIFIRMSNSQLDTFLPFSNAHYKNEFAHLLKADPAWLTTAQRLDAPEQKSGLSPEMLAFLGAVSYAQGFRPPTEQTTRPLDEWVANNALLRYDRGEGDNNMVILLDMFSTLCRERSVPNLEFFLNRRDFPQFTRNGTEPYFHIFGRNTPLLSHNAPKFAPLLSFSSNSEFADILCPTYEDWARVVYQEFGLVFPNTCAQYPKIVSKPWKEKKSVAVFRGSSTGVGVSDGEDGQPGPVNVRLAALRISSQYPDLLDVGITKWNLRPRKLESVPYLQTIRLRPINRLTAGTGTPLPVSNKLGLQDQSGYKYILHLEGNVAAYRLSYELSSGSTILLVEGRFRSWLHGRLVPYVHYVPVREDLSDLVSQILWCRNNDRKCEEIAQNAKVFYDRHLGYNAILDWLQSRLWDVAAVSGGYSTFPDLLLSSVAQETLLLQTALEDVVSDIPITNHSLPQVSRSIGLLDGMVPRMRSVTLGALEKRREIFRNVNGKVVLYTTGGFAVVGKIANNAAKRLEHVHESYIGIKAINSLLASVPNFCYVFGPVKNAPGTVFAEYIPGASLLEWLGSGMYNFKQLVSILLQVNLALKRAQDTVGFVHNDLYPWNVVVSTSLKGPATYFLDTKTVLGCNPDIVPVIIDYGKARALVYEGPGVGLIDRGFANIFRHGAILDTLTLLYGTLNVLADANRLGPNELGLLAFPARLGLPSHTDTRRWGKFGALFDFASEPNAPRIKGDYANPRHFVDFLFITTEPSNLPTVLNLAVGPPKGKNVNFSGYEMEKGIVPAVVAGYLATGTHAGALQAFIKHVDQSRPALPNADPFLAAVQANLLERRLEWVEKEILSPKTSARIRSQWNVVRRVLSGVRGPKTAPAPPLPAEPMPDEAYFDSELTPLEALRLLSRQPDVNDDDWVTARAVLVDAFLFSVFRPENTRFFDIGGFSFLNAVASFCTLKNITTNNAAPATSLRETLC